MIGDDDEIERPRELDLHAIRRGDLFAARETVRVLRTQARAESSGIHGCAGVHVRITKENLGWKIAPGVGGVALLGRKGIFQCFDGRERFVAESRNGCRGDEQTGPNYRNKSLRIRFHVFSYFGKIAFQSSFMLTTVQWSAFAVSSALDKVPILESRS